MTTDRQRIADDWRLELSRETADAIALQAAVAQRDDAERRVRLWRGATVILAAALVAVGVAVAK